MSTTSNDFTPRSTKKGRVLRVTWISLAAVIALIVAFLTIVRTAQSDTADVGAPYTRNSDMSLLSTVIYGALEIHGRVAPLTLSSLEAADAPLVLKKSYPDASVRRIDTGSIRSVQVSARGANPRHVIFFIHGGGWATGLNDRYVTMAIALSRKTGYRVVMPEYGLLPQHRFPTALNQVESALESVERETQPTKVVFGGDSAGANLSLALTFLREQRHLPLPVAQFLFSPVSDLTLSSGTLTSRASADPMLTKSLLKDSVDAYVGGATSLTDPLVSPIFGDFAGYPPTIIEAGSQEVLLGDALALYRKILADGSTAKLDVWKGLWHAFPIVSNVPESSRALDLVADYIHRGQPD
jgi:epsilon-lactone hydrolase